MAQKSSYEERSGCILSVLFAIFEGIVFIGTVIFIAVEWPSDGVIRGIKSINDFWICIRTALILHFLAVLVALCVCLFDKSLGKLYIKMVCITFVLLFFGCMLS